MEKRKILNKDISLLGFGTLRLPMKKSPAGPLDFDEEASIKLFDYAMANGINYFDTAYTYGNAEEISGRALSNYPRESYNIATKCPPWKVKNAGEFEQIFTGQLERCKTDYFDFYLVHNFAQEMKRALNNDEYFENFEKIGFYDMLKKKKDEGKIRHIGFSFHGTLSLLQKIVDKYEWDFAQIQLNYIDWTATNAKSQYELLTKHNIPVVIMNPLRGGVMASLSEESAKLLKDADPNASLASWGLRFAASLPNVMTVLSGPNLIEHLQENVATMNNFRPVSDKEKELLYECAVLFNKSGLIPCTGCGYCLPCHRGVDIPRIISLYNYVRLTNSRIPFDNAYASLEPDQKVSRCILCGQCMQRCPQAIYLPKYMLEIDNFVNAM